MSGVVIDDEVKNLVDYIRTLHEGDHVDHSTVETIIKYKRPPTRDMTYYRIVSRTKVILFRKYNIVIINVPGFGYKIITNPERIIEARQEGKKGIKYIRFGKRLLDSVDSTKINAKQEEVRSFITSIYNKAIKLFTESTFKSKY